MGQCMGKTPTATKYIIHNSPVKTARNHNLPPLPLDGSYDDELPLPKLQQNHP
jgi:hypothetical protein